MPLVTWEDVRSAVLEVVRLSLTQRDAESISEKLNERLVYHQREIELDEPV